MDFFKQSYLWPSLFGVVTLALLEIYNAKKNLRKIKWGLIVGFLAGTFIGHLIKYNWSYFSALL